jgi:hypothetical protein
LDRVVAPSPPPPLVLTAWSYVVFINELDVLVASSVNTFISFSVLYGSL